MSCCSSLFSYLFVRVLFSSVIPSVRSLVRLSFLSSLITFLPPSLPSSFFFIHVFSSVCHYSLLPLVLYLSCVMSLFLSSSFVDSLLLYPFVLPLVRSFLRPFLVLLCSLFYCVLSFSVVYLLLSAVLLSLFMFLFIYFSMGWLTDRPIS